MAGADDRGGDLLGFSVPVHRALTEPILLGGAPRAIAIMNGTLAGAMPAVQEQNDVVFARLL